MFKKSYQFIKKRNIITKMGKASWTYSINNIPVSPTKPYNIFHISALTVRKT